MNVSLNWVSDILSGHLQSLICVDFKPLLNLPSVGNNLFHLGQLFVNLYPPYRKLQNGCYCGLPYLGAANPESLAKSQ